MLTRLYLGIFFACFQPAGSCCQPIKPPPWTHHPPSHSHSHSHHTQSQCVFPSSDLQISVQNQVSPPSPPPPPRRPNPSGAPWLTITRLVWESGKGHWAYQLSSRLRAAELRQEKGPRAPCPPPLATLRWLWGGYFPSSAFFLAGFHESADQTERRRTEPHRRSTVHTAAIANS